MATTLTITAKTPTTISATITKTSTTAGIFAVGPGTTWTDIVNNEVAMTTFGNGQTGTFNLTLTGLSPNTQYGGVAGILGGGDSEISNIVDATLPSSAPTQLKLLSVQKNYGSFSILLSADGDYYQRALQTSMDGGATWTTRATFRGSSPYTLNFTSPQNLSPRTTYTMQTRISTTAGSTLGPSITFTTAGDPRKKVYGSVNGSARWLTSLYGGSNSGAKTITKLYGSVNGEAKLIHQSFGHVTYT